MSNHYRTQTSVRFCPHGQNPCIGNPDRGIPPCHPGEYIYCAHGIDDRALTKDTDSRCPYCRGVTRKERNRDTWRPRRGSTLAITERQD